MIFLKEYMEIWSFLHICINATNMTILFCQKIQRQSSPQKIRLQVIDILEIAPMIICFFMDTFIGVFMYCLPVKKKKTGNLIYRIKIWLHLQFTWLEIFYNKKLLKLKTIQCSGVVCRGARERQLRKLFVH